jgi:hypothetical protein
MVLDEFFVGRIEFQKISESGRGFSNRNANLGRINPKSHFLSQRMWLAQQLQFDASHQKIQLMVYMQADVLKEFIAAIYLVL